MEVIDNGSDHQSAYRAENRCSKQEYTNGYALVSHINSCLYHGDRRRHPPLSAQIPHKEPPYAEVEVEGKEEAKAVRYDTQQTHNHANVWLSSWELLLVSITDLPCDDLR